MAGLFENLFGGAASAGGIYKLMDMLKENRDQVGDTVGGLEGDIRDNIQFNPYSVMSGIGKSTMGPGGITQELSPEMQRMQDMFFGGARDTMGQSGQNQDYMQSLLTDGLRNKANPASYTGMAGLARGAEGLANQYMGLAGQDPTQREGDVYNRIRAMQAPEEERQRNSMQAGLFASGRGGMGSSTYGSTPEQFGFEKARGEAMNQAGYQAMNQAQQEMMNYGNLGQQYGGMHSNLRGQQQNLANQNINNILGITSGIGGLGSQAAQTSQGMFNAGMSPYGALGNQIGYGQASQGMGLETDLNRQKMLTDLGLGGLGTELNYSNVMANLLGQAIPGLAGAASGIGGVLDDQGGLGGLFEKLKGYL